MTRIKFNSIEEVYECYGRDNLVFIDNLSQIIAYTKEGCQPKWICENELKPGRITCLFSKDETQWVYKKWQESHPRKDK